MIPPIFKDTSLQEKLEKQGYVVVDFLTENDVELLNTIFDKLHASLPESAGFVSGSYSNDFNYKKEASDTILSVFSKYFEQIFKDYQAFGAAFLYKLSTAGSELGVHQDWTIVDEEKYVALNCWVPLTDVNEKNGALHVLPGSQYPKIVTVRAPTLPFFFRGSEAQVISNTIPQYIKAGQAVILNQSVIHYSPPNRSGKIRKAITAGVKTKGAPMIFHYKTTDDKVERFEMPEDFLLRFEDFGTSIFQAPVLGKRISIFDYHSPVLEGQMVIDRIKSVKEASGLGERNRTFFEKIFSKFKIK